MTTPLGTLGPPGDAAGWLALGLAVALLLAARRLAGVPAPRLALAAFAAALSAGYVAHYLRGGPRIVDATTYFLQARGLSAGDVTLELLAPSGSFRGRFLLAGDDGARVAGIFPPGYPAVLSLGFLVGQPLAVGPLLAFAVVLATAALARRLHGDAEARLAAALSVVCAALRYHTADTMSHGLGALLFTLALLGALGDGRRSAALAGLAAGALVATRPVTGAVALLAASLASRRRPARVAWLLVGAAPPVVLLFAEQWRATGEIFGSTQLAYYALADGPPGCFRYGFGAGIGCLHEHGDFVRARLPDGYGLREALATSLRRLAAHAGDAGNGALFAPVVVLGLARAARSQALRVLPVAALGLLLAYAPFYFDGSYPGGGARLLAELLPLEHVAAAAVLVRAGAGRFGVPLALLCFAVQGSHAHRALAGREGGRPMYEPEVVRRAGVTRGLVLVDTDHGFSLGFDPRSLRDPAALVVARRRRDAHDVLLWERLGRPPVYEYLYALDGSAPPSVAALPLAPTPELLVEAEAEWPPLAVEGGWVRPSYPACASGGRALALAPTSPAGLRVRLALPYRAAGPHLFVLRTEGRGDFTVTLAGETWVDSAPGPAGTCGRTGPRRVVLGRAAASPRPAGPGVGATAPGSAEEPLEIWTLGPIAIDAAELVPVPR